MRENEKAHHVSVLKQQAYDAAMERIRDKVFYHLIIDIQWPLPHHPALHPSFFSTLLPPQLHPNLYLLSAITHNRTCYSGISKNLLKREDSMKVLVNLADDSRNESNTRNICVGRELNYSSNNYRLRINFLFLFYSLKLDSEPFSSGFSVCTCALFTHQTVRTDSTDRGMDMLYIIQKL